MKTHFDRARRGFLSAITISLGLAAAAGVGNAWAEPAGKKAPAASAGHHWSLVINEAVTGETNSFVLTNRYLPLAGFLSKELHGQIITVNPLVDIQHFMTLAQGNPKPELVFGKSVNQMAKLVRDHGYQPIVRRADPYRSAFIVAKGSPLKILADAGGAKIIMPDVSSATSALAVAELRRQRVTVGQVTHVKFQDEVAQYIKSGLGQVGVVNPTIAKKWAEEGGRVLAETQPVANWSLLAAPSMPKEVVQQLREALLREGADTAAVLAAVGVKAWTEAEPADYMKLLAYTGE